MSDTRGEDRGRARRGKPWWILLVPASAAALSAVVYGAVWLVERLDQRDLLPKGLETQISLWLVLAPALWSAAVATLAHALRRARERRAGAMLTQRWRLLPVWGWALLSWVGAIAVYYGLEWLHRTVGGQTWAAGWWPTNLTFRILIPLMVCTLVGAAVALPLVRCRRGGRGWRGVWPYAAGALAACATIYPLVRSAMLGGAVWKFWAWFGVWGLCMYTPLIWWACGEAVRAGRGCPKCGYDLSGLAAGAACPECGAGAA